MSDRQPWVSAALTGDRRALVEQWQHAAAPGAARDDVTGPIPRRPAGEPAPLSYAQERLWFLEQLHPGQALYVVPLVVRLSVPVSAVVLGRTLHEIVRRHEVLRSAFVTVNDHPCQVVDAAASCPFDHHDLRTLPEDDRLAAVRDMLQREAETPFDLAVPCRLRSHLLTLATADHVLLCTFHHAAFDGWSTTPFLRELTAIYAATARGERAALPPLPIQYADYAAWQRHAFADPPRRRVLLDYWTRRLAHLRVPEIPSDFPRPLRPSYAAGRQTLLLPASLVSGLKILAQRESVTPFMVLLAAVSVVIQRYTAKDDVCVATSVAGRSQAELEPLIGCCLNTLVLRTDLAGDPRVSELLGRVRETALGAFAHQTLPFELLLQEIVPARDLSRTPLFQVYVNYLNVGELDPVSERSGMAVAAAPHDVADGSDMPAAGDDTHAPFDLSLYARPTGDHIALSLVYARDLFSRSTADDFLRDVRAVIGAMAEHPDDRVSTLPLAPDVRQAPSSRRSVAAPATWRPWPPDACDTSIGARFLATAYEFAGRPAISRGTATVTYAELARNSARVASYLRPLAGPGARVALLVGHDEAMIAAVLGVLHSGAAYVPLDPAHPPDRLAAIVRASRPVAVVADEPRLELARALLSQTGDEIRVGRLEDILERPDDPHEMAATEPEAIAYLLYTSGSTGLPKGVVQSHRNVLRHIRAYASSLHLTADDRLTLLASYGFDAAVMDIFGALLTGACLLPVDLRGDGEAGLAAALSTATILHATPTVYRHLLAALPSADLSGVRAVVLGGEPAARADVDLHRQRFTDRAALVNGLGPTESTTALQFVVDRSTAVRGPVVPVGFALPGTTVTLVNADRREVGALAVGEIAITSEHVALGYWGDPAATAAAFLGNPRSPGPRTYFTGDFARRDRQGCIEYLGRRDGQVKVRGVRIEPAEIERALLEHPAFGAAAVQLVAEGAEGGESRLAAYVVCRDGPEPDAAALRRFLRDRLPDVMIPASFVVLERLPMTVNGKLDRAALPALAAGRPLPTGADGDEAATPTERLVAAIWSVVLGIADVRRDVSFFDLGGHSLLATQVVSRVRSTLGREVALRAIFEAPTLATFSRRVDEAPVTPAASPLPADMPLARAARERYKVRLTERGPHG